MIGKIKVELLSLFFLNPENEYYIGEIGRILNKKNGMFQKTLENLVKEGILISEYRGNLRYFKLNSSYIFYDELKSIVNKTAVIFITLKNELKDIKNIKYAFVYGSFASSRTHQYSDIYL